MYEFCQPSTQGVFYHFSWPTRSLTKYIRYRVNIEYLKRKRETRLKHLRGSVSQVGTPPDSGHTVNNLLAEIREQVCPEKESGLFWRSVREQLHTFCRKKAQLEIRKSRDPLSHR